MLSAKQTSPESLPRILIIGAGSRGNAYARAVKESGDGIVAAVAEPLKFKRRLLGSKYVWHDSQPSPNQEFEDWKAFIKYEIKRRNDAAAGTEVPPGIDGIFICVLDEQHATVITSLAPLKIHILCEKPLATSLQDCLDIYTSMSSQKSQAAIFGIGHVLRYSPHNMLLRRLVVQDQIIGPVVSVEHTEPVGHWHFSHSYVRGNWRKEESTAPSLLTKSCHDLDFLLWMLCSPPSGRRDVPPHLPASVASFGSLKQFRKSRKPPSAGSATNCLQCPIESTCIYSAPRIYYDNQLAKGNTDWPVNIVNPEIEDCYSTLGLAAAKEMLYDSLAADYDGKTSSEEVDKRPWFGRCVWEAKNNVVDDQYVLINWDDDLLSEDAGNRLEQNAPARVAKTASFHMIAQTEKQCERRGRIYGEKGEISYDGTTITIYDFASGEFRHHHPPRPGGGHGGGDSGLALSFLRAIEAVKKHGMSVEDAQAEHLGCTLEEIIRSHALVFAAEEARISNKLVDWKAWWSDNIVRATAV